MTWLEMNKRLLEEIRAADLKRGTVIARHRAVFMDAVTKVTAIGSYPSGTRNHEVYLALKEYASKRPRLEETIRQDLTIFAATEIYAPHLLDELPLVHGLLVGKDKQPLGLITEDFSQGGQFHVYGYADDRLPDLERITGLTLHQADIASACFLVNGSRRIGDIEALLFSDANRAQRRTHYRSA